VINSIGDFDRRFPIISHRCVNGEGIGAFRTMTLNEGEDTGSRPLEIDSVAMSVRAEGTHSPWPATVVGFMRIRHMPNRRNSISLASKISRLFWLGNSARVAF
jgi:hypothetical protein